jgi:hypothetical protein
MPFAPCGKLHIRRIDAQQQRILRRIEIGDHRHRIIPGFRKDRHMIRARPEGNKVHPILDDHTIIPISGDDHIGAVAVRIPQVVPGIIDVVIPLSAIQDIRPDPADNQIIARTTGHGIITVIPEQVIIPAPTKEPVIPLAAKNGIIGRIAQHHVIPGIAENRIMVAAQFLGNGDQIALFSTLNIGKSILILIGRQQVTFGKDILGGQKRIVHKRPLHLFDGGFVQQGQILFQIGVIHPLRSIIL